MQYNATLEDLKLERWFRNRNNGNITWKMKNGNVIPIKDMSDEHLDNTIKMIQRKISLHQDLEFFDDFYTNDDLMDID